MSTEVKAVMYGTYPAATTTEAVDIIARELGPYFDKSMPNGEVSADQIDWHKLKMARAGQHEGVRTIKRGSLNSLTTAPIYGLEPGYPQLPTHTNLDTTYYDDARTTIADFEAGRDAHGLDHLKMQLDWANTMEDPALWFSINTLWRGLKSGVSELSLRRFWGNARGFKEGFFRGIGEFEYAFHDPFKIVTERHVQRIAADPQLDGKLVHQQSTPIGHTLVSMLYRMRASNRLKAAATDYVTDSVAEQVRTHPTYWEEAVHACLTDLQGKAPSTPQHNKSWAMEGSVAYTNVLMSKWPAGHQPPLYIGIPATTNMRPASTNREFYAPLRDLDLPSTTRLAMGIVHRAMDLDGHKRIVDIIRDIYDGPLSISQPCGAGRLREAVLGSEGREAAITSLRLTRDVIEYANS